MDRDSFAHRFACVCLCEWIHILSLLQFAIYRAWFLGMIVSLSGLVWECNLIVACLFSIVSTASAHTQREKNLSQFAIFFLLLSLTFFIRFDSKAIFCLTLEKNHTRKYQHTYKHREWVRVSEIEDQVNSASSMVIVKLYRALVSIYLFIFIASIYSSQAFSKDTLQILQRIESKQIEKYKRSIQIIQQIHFRTDCSSAGVYTFFMWLPHLFVHWCYAIGAFFSVYIHLNVVDKR